MLLSVPPFPCEFHGRHEASGEKKRKEIRGIITFNIVLV